MERPVRVLDDQAVEAAEFFRKTGWIEMAAATAAVGLGLTSSPLVKEEVDQLADDPIQRAILACLARIHVDSLKSIANRAKFPWKALPPLEGAAKTIGVVYRHRGLHSQLLDVAQDHRGRTHHFLTEMARDEAKTLEAASVLFLHQGLAYLLIQRASDVLADAGSTLPYDHPVKPLIGIEVQLLRARLGNTTLNPRSFQEDFKKLASSDLKTNPHRVATVASWLIVWGERLNIEGVWEEGSKVFKEITQAHPEWAFMVESEKRKLARQAKRELLFRVLTPLTTGFHRRNRLYSWLMNTD